MEFCAFGAGQWDLRRHRLLPQREDGRQQRGGRMGAQRRRRRRGGEAVLPRRIQLEPVPAGPGGPTVGAAELGAGVDAVAGVPRFPAQHCATAAKPDLRRRPGGYLAIGGRLLELAQEHGCRHIGCSRSRRRCVNRGIKNTATTLKKKKKCFRENHYSSSCVQMRAPAREVRMGAKKHRPEGSETVPEVTIQSLWDRTSAWSLPRRSMHCSWSLLCFSFNYLYAKFGSMMAWSLLLHLLCFLTSSQIKICKQYLIQ